MQLQSLHCYLLLTKAFPPTVEVQLSRTMTCVWHLAAWHWRFMTAEYPEMRWSFVRLRVEHWLVGNRAVNWLWLWLPSMNSMPANFTLSLFEFCVNCFVRSWDNTSVCFHSDIFRDSYVHSCSTAFALLSLSLGSKRFIPYIYIHLMYQQAKLQLKNSPQRSLNRVQNSFCVIRNGGLTDMKAIIDHFTPFCVGIKRIPNAHSYNLLGATVCLLAYLVPGSKKWIHTLGCRWGRGSKPAARYK